MPLPTPAEFGAPSKFSSWRKFQDKAVETVVDSIKRFVGLCLPTGSGKTLIYMITALLTGARVCVLTSTKALQDQLLEDWTEQGLVDIRGQANYPCVELQPGGRWWRSDRDSFKTNCDSGPCHTGSQCELRNGGCHYFDALRNAKNSKLVVTNYSCWMALEKYREGLGDFDMLVLDEAHLSTEELSSFLHVDLTKVEAEGIIGATMPEHEDQTEWSSWAGEHHSQVEVWIENLREQQKVMYSRDAAKEIRELRKVLSKLGSIMGMQGDWVIEQVKGEKKKVTFDPVWPAPYAEDCLFLEIPKILLVSATIRKRTCELLGVPLDELEFLEQRSTFPIKRRPLIHVPTIRVNHRSTDVDLRHWVRRIDDIIDGRLDRKGIIHTVSFKRRKFLKEHSRHSDIMLANVSGNTRSVVERFKRAEPPLVLVSPSISTGYDFPGATCHYQIIGKVPFPDNRSKILQARSEHSEDYTSYLAMQSLVQSYGRGMRAEDDMCEVLCVDDNLKWFIWLHKDFAPRWFLDAYKSWDSLTSVPKPLKI